MAVEKVVDLGPLTAYDFAVEGGYEGTEEEFEEALGGAGEAVSYAQQAVEIAQDAASNANEKASLAQTAAGNANQKAELAETKAGLADTAATRANQAAASAENMAGIVAPVYSALSTYEVGEYVTYNGAMYRCITAIDTAEEWTAAHWQAVNVGSEVSDLKSAINTNFLKNLMGVGADLSKNVRPSGWEHASATLTFADNVMKVDATEQYGGAKYAVNVEDAHVLYYYSVLKANSNKVSLSWNGNQAVMSSGSGSYELISKTYAFSGSSSQKISILDGRISDRDTIYVKDIGVIDLTATFGSGNEKTKEEMDAIVTQNPYIVDSFGVGALANVAYKSVEQLSEDTNIKLRNILGTLAYPQGKIESYGVKNIFLVQNNSAQVDLINAVLKAEKSYKVHIEFTSIESGDNIYLYATDENNNSMWKAGSSIGFGSSMLKNTYSLVIPQSDTKIRIYAVARRAGILKEAYIITGAFDDYVTEDYFEQSKINILPYDQSAYEYGGISNTTGENTSQDRSIRTKDYINVTDTSLYCIYGGTSFAIYCFCYTDSAFLSRIDLRNNSANNPLPSGTTKVKFVIYNELKYNNNNTLMDYISDGVLVAENSKYTDYVDNRVIKSNLIDDRSIGKAKFVRHTIDEDLIHENSIGEYSLNPQYVTFKNSLANLLPTNDYWELGYWSGTGAGTVPGQSYHTKSVRTKASKLIEVYSGAIINVKDFSSNTYQVTLNYYDENSDFLEQKGFLTNVYTERVYTAPTNAKYLRISIFNDGWTVSDATVKDYVPFELQLTIGERQATDVCPIVINTEHIDEHGIPLDKLEEEYPVPSYYFVNEYLQDKAARIKELAQAAGADGDTFIFISDMHWDKSVPHQSPNIIRYLSKHVHLPRVFNGGDVGDTGNADGADAIRKALYPTHEHHIACGNHEWFAHVTGNKLYYDYDIFNNDQIGNANRHYFYVDNVQNKVRYIVLSSHSEMEPDGQAAGYGYEQEQLDWFENIALNVESGWKILVFAHEVIGLQTWSKDGTYGIFSYAQPMINICDAYQGNGTICAILCGDQHVDRIGYTSTDIPIVCTTCDTNTPSLLPSDDQIRMTGTINEGAFDVVILNGNTKTIHFVRIGAKAYNRVVNSGTDYVEERTVQYP